MKNKNKWKPSKFIKNNSGKWVANSNQVSFSSLYLCNLYIAQYEKVIKKYSKGLLLDLGCGNVPYYEIYKDNVIDNVCVDWGNSLHKNPYLDIEADLNKPFPFEDDSFDSILCADVLEHIAEPHQFINEIGRVLNPGGNAIIMVPFLYWLHEEPHDYFRYTKHALKHLVEKSGLEVLELNEYGLYSDVLLDIFSKGLPRSILAYRFILAMKWFFKSIFKYLNHKIGKRFPLGYIMVLSKKSQEN